MRLRTGISGKTHALPFRLLKSGAVLLLFLLSILVVACSGGAGGDTGSTSAGGPVVTVTIHLNNGAMSPTPPLPAYTCGAWATQTSPTYGMSTVGVYAKFTQTVNDNPEGVDGATATATILWPDTTTDNETTLTTADGLAIFSVPIANRKDTVNAVTLITVTFSKAGIPNCTVGTDRAAFFTVVVPSPTPTKAASPTATGTPGVTLTPVVTPTP